MTKDIDSKLPEPGQFPRTTVVLYSGGIDSTTLLYLLSSRETTKRLRAVTINYGQIDFEQAYGAVNRFSTDLNIPVQLIDVPNLSRSG